MICIRDSVCWASLLVLPLLPAVSVSAEPQPLCLVIDVYFHGGDAAEHGVAAAAAVFAERRGGIAIQTHDLDAAGDAREKLAALAARLAIDVAATPVVFGCNRVATRIPDAAAVEDHLQEICGITFFTRPGCGRCADAKAWLPTLLFRYPAFTVTTVDIGADAAGRARLERIVKKNGVGGVSVPVFQVCNSVVIGFDAATTTGRRIEEFIGRWAGECPPPEPPQIGVRGDATTTITHAMNEDVATAVGEPLLQRIESGRAPEPIEPTAINAPILEMFNGQLDARRLGMPLFTLAIGLIDGFNPCAMWVLLLLLSVLVNLKDRVRVIAIAGTFVCVSGAAYFAFMAAWLNVFQWIGYVRPVQVCLGLVAVVIGMIHVKDFFAFKQGVSLSIPEAAKPGIYDRMRRIVTADNLPAAIAGAFTLAVLVNIVELLCTAGLPAVYTSILSQQGFSAAGHYGYLLLYIVAYMFDDALMVAGVVWTLSRLKLQETGGRWLKLVSGSVILLLGLAMLFKPEWLA